jgi:flagellar hook-length control protein FliK
VTWLEILYEGWIMTNLPIAVSAPAPAASRRTQANAVQQNAGLPGAAPAEEGSFHAALVQMLGKGLGKSFLAAGDAAAVSSKADASPKTGAEADPAPDAGALPDALALQPGLAVALPPGLAPSLTPAAAMQAGLGTAVASSKAALGQQPGSDTAPALDASALPPVLASTLLPAATTQGGLRAVVASPKAGLGQVAGTDMAPVLDASALTTGLAQAHPVAKTAPADALAAARSEPLKDVLATPIFDTPSSRTEPPTVSSIAAQATDIGSSTSTRGVPEPSAAVQTRVGERGWDQAVGQKLVWMVNQKHQVAQLHLNPPDLGQLKIAISLDQNQASAQFFSAHASVREALEVAMPRLREMLADSGITLGNASVGTEAFREPTQQQPRAHVEQSGAVVADSGTVSSGERLLRPMLGLVDTFA